MTAMRIVVAVLALTCIALAYIVIADAPEPENADRARVAAAVEARLTQQQAEAQAVSDTRVANQASALYRDPGTPVLGNAQGDVAIVTFFDYTCSYCKAADPRVKALLEQDPDVKLVMKEYPILTPESLIASKAVLASMGQGKYEDYHNALMGFRGQLSEERIFEIAEEVGLDVARLRAEMNAPEIADQIIANFNLARALRISTTPTFIVDDHILTEPSAEIDFPAVVAAARTN